MAAVTEINFFDNHMIQQIVQVSDDATWKDAYVEFLKTKNKDDEVFMEDDVYMEWMLGLSDDLEEARDDLYNSEMDVVVTFIE